MMWYALNGQYKTCNMFSNALKGCDAANNHLIFWNAIYSHRCFTQTSYSASDREALTMLCVKPSRLVNRPHAHVLAPRSVRQPVSIPVRCQREQPQLQPNELQLPQRRRSLQVTFTCNLCGTRTMRMVNPTAWDRGMVLAQCEHCAMWHKLQDKAGLIDEIVYVTDDESDSESPKGMMRPDEGV